MNHQLEDIEKAIADGTLDEKDKVTLEDFAKVIPRTSGNPAYHQRVEQAQRRVQLALTAIYSKEKEELEKARHDAAIKAAHGANSISKWAIVIAIAALIISVVQTFWNTQ